MSTPLHKPKAPRANIKPPCWRLSGDGSVSGNCHGVPKLCYYSSYTFE